MKESVIERNKELLHGIDSLLDALRLCAIYCHKHDLPFLFSRAAYSVADARELLFPVAGDVDRTFIQSTSLNYQFPVIETNGAHLETVRLGKLTVPRLFNGLWQMSSASAWGSASPER